MTDIVNWAPAAADNVMQPPDGLPEHCLPSAVNDWARENMAAVRRWYGNTPLNVRNFGAVGDGVIDDTAAIQTAVTEAADKSLFFPPGNYLIRDTITLPDASLRLFGDSMTITADEPINWPTSIVGSCFIIGDATTDDLHAYTFDNMGFTWQLDGTGTILYLPGASILTVQNCAGTGGTTFCQVDSGNVINFNNNTIANFNGFGLYLNGDVALARVINNHFVTTDTALHELTTCVYYSGIKTDNTGGTAFGTIIANNHFRLLTTDCMGVWVNSHTSEGETKDLLVSSNQFFASDTGSYGVFIGGTETAHHIQILDNFFESADVDNAMAPAVTAQSFTRNIQIINNQVIGWNAGTQGVFQFLGDNGIIAGNMVVSCSTPFIYSVGATNLQVYGNNDGTGDLHLGTESGSALAIIDPAIEISNYIEVVGGGSGINPIIRAVGSDANINLTLEGKAAGVTINGTLGVTDASVLNGTVTGNQFNIGGAEITGNLSVANTATFNAVTINGTSTLNGLVSSNNINVSNNVTIGANCTVGASFAAANISAGNAIAIGEGLSLGVNHVSDFALFTNSSTGNTTVQLGTGTFFTYVRATNRVQLWVAGVFQQQWPA